MVASLLDAETALKTQCAPLFACCLLRGVGASWPKHPLACLCALDLLFLLHIDVLEQLAALMDADLVVDVPDMYVDRMR